MNSASDGLTTTQKGSITEYAVATALMLGSSGRLSAFTPLADDHGIDLVVFDKQTGTMLPVQVKSWTKAPSRRGTVQFDVQKTTYSDGSTSVLIAVLFDPAEASIRMSWLLSLSDVPSVSVSRAGKYALTPSVRPGSSDRYKAFRHDSVQSMVGAVIDHVEGRQGPQLRAAAEGE
ncbi:MAG: hypothetical protein AAF563_04690 [Pseudomonadota bacterium]